MKIEEILVEVNNERDLIQYLLGQEISKRLGGFNPSTLWQAKKEIDKIQQDRATRRQNKNRGEERISTPRERPKERRR